MAKIILYIGNDLVKKTKYNSTMQTLTSLLIKENYLVYKTSNKLNQILRLLDMCFFVIKYRNKVDYIIIDTFSTKAFYYAFFTSQLARFFKIKYIPVLHGGNLPSRLDRFKKMSNAIFNNSYVNIAPSNFLKTEFEKRKYKTQFIPNVLEIENYRFLKRKKIEPKLLWVRAFDTIYNPKLAIKVIQLIKNKFPKAKLCMIGPVKDNTFKESKALVKELNLIENVEFTGVMHKEEWHKKSEEFSVFINTTNVDNTPVSVMEAMALGLPTVSTNVGGLPYLIENNIDGILVENNDAKKMAEAIVKIIVKNNTLLAKNARIKVETFRWEIVRDKWISILK